MKNDNGELSKRIANDSFKNRLVFSSRPTVNLLQGSELKDRFIFNLNSRGFRNGGLNKEDGLNCGYILAGAWFSITAVPKDLFNLISKDVVEWEKVEEIIEEYYSYNFD